MRVTRRKYVLVVSACSRGVSRDASSEGLVERTVCSCGLFVISLLSGRFFCVSFIFQDVSNVPSCSLSDCPYTWVSSRGSG